MAQHEASEVMIGNLSDEQIQKAVEEMNKRGLTLEQASQLARTRGASQQQIDQMTERMRQLQTRSTIPNATETAGSDRLRRDSVKHENILSKKNDLEISALNQKIFGFQLFNRKNLTFEPSLNIPMPADYVIGIGDEVIVQVWGSSQQSYNLEVDNNGAVNISGLGPVQIAGLNFKTARDLIIRRLTAIYSDMAGPYPGAYADVTVNNPHSIKINVIGEAIAPGTYTLPATASAFNALYLSGGPNENGSFRKILVMRDNKLCHTIDVYEYLLNGNSANNVTLRDQDILFIPPYQKRVETTGAFKRQAIFELTENETINDLIKYSGGFTESASASRLLLRRFTDNQRQLIDVNKDMFATIALKNGDWIKAEEVINRFENRLSIEGAVFRPGTYSLETGMTLSRLVKKAGGLREDYFPDRGLVIRLDNQLYPTVIPFDVDEVMQGKNDIPLQREDQVVIRDIFSLGEKKTVRIYGEVIKPGQYDFQKNMTMKDLIFLSGGMTEAASESYVEVARRNSYEEASTVNSKTASLFQFKIDRTLSLNAEDAAFKLEAFDQVYIRKAPSYDMQKTVFIGGEVKYPGEYSISDKNERISDLIRRAGGITPNAFVEGARLKRMLNGQQKDQLQVIKNMKENPDSTLWIDTTFQHTQLEIRLASILETPGTSYDYLLREGDQLTIPMEKEEIWVKGEVLNPIGLAWEKGKGLDYYVERSGGYGPNAKKNKAYVVYSNGTTQVTKGILIRNYPDVNPGSQIIIPSKPVRKQGNSGNWLAITSALSSLAIAAAAVFR